MEIYDSRKEKRPEKHFSDIPGGVVFSHGVVVFLKLCKPSYKLVWVSGDRPKLQEVNVIQLSDLYGKSEREYSFSPETMVIEHPEATLYLKG